MYVYPLARIIRGWPACSFLEDASITTQFVYTTLFLHVGSKSCKQMTADRVFLAAAC